MITSSTTIFLFLFIVCETTCFDLFTRSSSGLLTLRVQDTIYVLGSQHVYIDKIYDCHVSYNGRDGIIYFTNVNMLGSQHIYRVSQDECARLRESVPYVKVYRYNPKHLYQKLNGYGDNGQRKVWSACGSKYCTCSADALRVHQKCAVSKVKSVLQYCWIFMCHVKCLES